MVGLYQRYHRLCLMYKIDEQNMKGKDSQLLHIDDWEELDKFYHHPLAKIMYWSASSK